MVDSIGKSSSGLTPVSAVSLNTSNASGDASSAQTTASTTDDGSKSSSVISVSGVKNTASPQSTASSTSSTAKVKSTTSTAASFSEALAVAGPPVNKAKIQAIRVLIAEGRYPISASMISAKMVQYETSGSLTTSSASSVSSGS